MTHPRGINHCVIHLSHRPFELRNISYVIRKTANLINDIWFKKQMHDVPECQFLTFIQKQLCMCELY